MNASLLTRLGLTTYGLYCMGVSLRKRWWQPTLTAALLGLGMLAAQVSTRTGLGAALLAAFLHAGWIALHSAYRHRHDLPVQTLPYAGHHSGSAQR